jgi:acetoin utilization deacetylase AcuC-like enzyme
MRTFYSDDHHLHVSHGELLFGEFVPAFEKPERADLILARIQAIGLGPVSPPSDFPREALLRVHEAGMVELIETGHAQWRAAGREGNALPFSWRARGMRDDRVPGFIDGKLSHYCFDAGTPLTDTTWRAVRQSANVALSGASVIRDGARSVFSLCRPPGHHAAASQYGGYCFLNNAAIAAQSLLDHGAGRIAVLDVDYHHGNGTQAIFEARADVLFTSIHGDPDFEYPFLSGYADEVGTGLGEGFNLNLPLAAGSGWDVWSAALEQCCERIEGYGPDVVVVSLGVDTYKDDPISQFRLEPDDFTRLGERIARLGRPTHFLMEGGYAVAEIGVNVGNVLAGFSGV